MNQDPLLDADLALLPGSPCIDAGANNAVAVDVMDVDDDGSTTERTPLDLNGSPRFANGNGLSTGCGEPAKVDMGALEFAGVSQNDTLIGDADGDGSVNFADLLHALADWGDCQVGCCLADINVDGVVDFDDALVILTNWGA